MAKEQKEIKAGLHTLVNKLDVDPERSLVPVIMAGDRCLIQPIKTEDDEYFNKNIDLKKPVSIQEQYRKGKVVSIGGGEYGTAVPSSLKVDQIVNYWYSESQTLPFELDGVKYDCVRASDIFMWL